jgi:multidrug efflux pump subunit AcrB
MVAITARITGRDLGSTVRDVQRTLDKPDFLPKTVPYTLGGLYEQQQIAFKGLRIVLVAAIILVVLLLLFLYESFSVTIAMLITTLSAGAAVYVGLWITGTEFNITSRMGVTMIVGVSACFTGPDGRRVQYSTKETDRKRAQKIADHYLAR